MINKLKFILSYLIIYSLFMLLYGCSGESNVIPPAKLVDFKPSLKVKQIWSKDIGNGEDGQYLNFSPVLSKGVIYTASFDGYVMAVGFRNGKTIWSKQLDLSLSSTPLVTKQHVYVGSMFGKLAKLDIRNGGLLWQIDVPSSVFAAPAEANGIVVVNTLNGEVSAYDAISGNVKWSQVVGTPPLMLTGNSSPVVLGNQVFVGMDNGELWAYDIETGVKLWDVPVAVPEGGSDVSRMVDIVGTPVIENGIIYVATYQGNVAAINSQNGAIVWKKKMSTYDSIAIQDDLLFVTDTESYIYALDKTTGVKKWEQKILRGRSVTAPVTVNDYIAVSDFEGYVHFFNQKNGNYAARIKIGGDGIISQGVADHNAVYVQTNNGTLAAIKI